MRFSARVFGVGTAAVLCLTGCSAESTDPRRTEVEMRLLVSPVMPPGASGVGYDGVVEVDSGGCFAVRGAALVGLPGSTLNDDGSFTLVNPGGLADAVTFRVGDQYDLGGTLADKDADFVQPYLPEGARSCGSEKVLMVFGG